MNVLNGLENNPEAFHYLVGGSCSLGAALFLTAFALVRCVPGLGSVNGGVGLDPSNL